MPDGLLHSQGKGGLKPLVFVLLAVVILGAAGGGAYFFMTRPKAPSRQTVETRRAEEYILEEEPLERRLYPGDSVLVSQANVRLEFSGVDESVHISSPGGDIVLNLSEEKEIDLNADGAPDVTITLSDFARNDPAQGGLFRFTASAPVPGEGGLLQPAATVEKQSAVIFTSPSPYPFTVQAVFSGYCLFRYESDNNRREERYYADKASIDIQSQNRLRIWVSNASAVKLQVIGSGKTTDLNVGGPGEVAVKYIHWVPDENNRYKLVSDELD